MDYTIIGGGVNLASRLETAAGLGQILISYETHALVKDEIKCEFFGEIDVKCVAYPVATYEVVDSYDNLGRQRRLIHESAPHWSLDLDLDAMSADERSQAEAILRRTLKRETAASPESIPGKPAGSGRRGTARARAGNGTKKLRSSKTR